MINNDLSKPWSDWVKLIAAILVAVSHYSTVIVINNHWSDNAVLRLFCQGGFIGVAIFFFYSGYGLMASDIRQHLPFIDFLKRRLVKVYLPVIIVSVIWMPIYYLWVSNDNRSLSIDQIIYDLFWGFKDPVLWFVKILFMLYGIFYFFSFLQSKQKKLLSHAVLILGASVAMLISCKAFGDFSIISIPIFIIGIYTSFYKNKRIIHFPTSILLLVLMAVISTGIFGAYHDTTAAHALVNSVVMIAVLCLVIALKNFTPPICFQKRGYQQHIQYTSYTLRCSILW